ncbi:hypothetical protein GO491_03425 [Flavobacteriaceae bacterium Ap0902]|nr:hypothetical protein [Flavobacteriaceae bacterium Ap0902]
MTDKQPHSEKSLALQKVSADLLHIKLDENQDDQKQFNAMVKHVDYLIQYDFNKLLNILYRVDVSEEKLKQALSENEKSKASVVISLLLIEREIQKRAFRAKYSQKK